MSIPQKDVKLLWGRAANRCAICRVVLTSNTRTGSVSSVIGQQAHIVAEEADGPRGNSVLTIEERNCYHNLLLLCPTHHSLIDKNVDEYPVETLYSIKSRHELWVEETLGREDVRSSSDIVPIEDILELLGELRPLLLWLHRIVPREVAPKFLASLQGFWYSYNIAHENIDDRLSGALDCLLRPLAAGEPDGK